MAPKISKNNILKDNLTNTIIRKFNKTEILNLSLLVLILSETVESLF